jgi:hypothetical protein
MEKKSTTEDMTTMVTSLAKARKDGYTLDFTVGPKGLSVVNGNRFYAPEEITIDNFHRFEGASDPADNVILYFIKTADGMKGTLSDAFGTYADPAVGQFMKKVEEISKQSTSK